jgi:hypothetical protein
MSKKRRMKRGTRADVRATSVVPPRAAAPAPALVWEANVFGAGGYESAARFLLKGLIEAGADVQIRPFWGDNTLRGLDA